MSFVHQKIEFAAPRRGGFLPAQDCSSLPVPHHFGICFPPPPVLNSILLYFKFPRGVFGVPKFCTTTCLMPLAFLAVSGIKHSILTTICAILVAYIAPYRCPPLFGDMIDANGLRIFDISSRLTWVYIWVVLMLE